ncbi:MAG TPA: hypothetical protein PKW66_24175, partial [Polyangiaceae bacterium]|nr:hypothetical protein [Polyangiaceae bacterium]
GPEPGMGCAGRGVSLMIERLEQLRLVEQGHYEVVVYDVLGDVVCGGFAAPLRRGIGQYVYIVTSEETMSLYAANNIAKAVVRYSRNGIMLAGLIANQREIGDFSDMLNAFAESLGTRLCALFHRDPLVRKAENRFQTVVEAAPDSKISLQFQELAAQMALREPQPYPIPTPLDQNQFVQFIRQYSRDEDLQDEPSDGNDNASASS